MQYPRGDRCAVLINDLPVSTAEANQALAAFLQPCWMPMTTGPNGPSHPARRRSRQSLQRGGQILDSRRLMPSIERRLRPAMRHSSLVSGLVR